LGALLRKLGEMKVQHVLLEGGSGLFTSAWEEGKVDKFMIFIAPVLLGGAGAPGIFGGKGFASPSEGRQVEALKVRKSDRDILLEGYPSTSAMTRAEGEAGGCLPV